MAGDRNPRWQGGRISKVCEECRQPFVVSRGRGDTARFCSLACTNVWQRRDRPNLGVQRKERSVVQCIVCGKDVRVVPSRVDRIRTCSPECSRKYVRVTMLPRSVYSNRKIGKRPDLGGQFFRSSWEANYARFLNWLKAAGEIRCWEYEADTFWFEAIRRGVRSYTPDFKVTDATGAIYYVEVKGWMDPKSATKIKRMAKYHPSIDFRVVDAKAYKALARQVAGLIPEWEGRAA